MTEPILYARNGSNGLDSVAPAKGLNCQVAPSLC